MNAQVQKIENAQGLALHYFTNGVFSRVMWQDQISVDLSAGTFQEFSCSEVYLRLYQQDGGGIYQVYPLRSRFATKMQVFDRALEWSGTCPIAGKDSDSKVSVDFCYRMELAADPCQALCWSTQVVIEFKGESQGSGIVWDLVFLEDRGLHDPAFLYGSELYASQYLDIQALRQNAQIALCFRQNLAGTEAPWLIESLNCEVKGFATNGHRFFGKIWEQDGFPQGLWQALAQEVEQEQFAISALASQCFCGSGSVERISVLESQHPVSREQDFGIWQQAQAYFSNYRQPERQVRSEIACCFSVPQIYHSPDLCPQELESLFPQRVLCEQIEGQLAAFFTPQHHHVVLGQKERQCLQSHCHIIRGGRKLSPSPRMPSLASFMNGCFMAHYAVGNTLYNSVISSPKFFVDLYKWSGVRISFAPKTQERQKFCQLGIPAAYEMAFCASRWYYGINGDILAVQVEFSTADQATLRVFSLEGKGYGLRFSIELEDTRSVDSQLPPVEWQDESTAVIRRHPESKAKFEPIKLLLENLQREPQSEAGLLCLQGELPGEKQGEEAGFCLESLASCQEAPWQKAQKAPWQAPQPIEFSGLADKELQQRLNASAYWFSHNAAVHFSVLYGAEQMKGAAWGVRDVLQGSLEYCLMTGEHDAAQRIMETVLSQQSLETGNWPQWFMLHDFCHIRDTHVHGDIPIWVLKALCEYTRCYGDKLLRAKLPFYSTEGQGFTEAWAVAKHVERLLQVIESSMQAHIYDFPVYGGGDWNDSLQPANQDSRQNLVSVWSGVLLTQYMADFAELCQIYNLPYLSQVETLRNRLCLGLDQLLRDFDYLPGFLLLEPQKKQVLPLMHEGEKLFPICYRLLPLKRAIKSKLIPLDRAQKFQQLIAKHLSHKDGVRLLDHVITYRGGESRFFLRLEQAAYFGREIGLMYTHAHLRYVEALLDLRMTAQALAELDKVLPMQLHQRIPGLLPRQGNSYFASSDLQMATRYEFSGKLNAQVSQNMLARGGWRIYSSGPGITLSLLRQQLLGIRRLDGGNRLQLNPLIAANLLPNSRSFCVRIIHPFAGLTAANKLLVVEITLDTSDDTSDKAELNFAELRVQQVLLSGIPVPIEPLENAYGYAGITMARFGVEERLLQIVLA